VLEKQNIYTFIVKDMEEAKIKSLLKKYAEGNSSPEEIAFLEGWYIQWNKDRPFGLTSQDLNSDLLLIKAHTPDLKNGTKRLDLWPKVMAAAVVLFIVTAGISFYLNKGGDQDTEKKLAKVPGQEIVPGGQKAILTLSNGARISLTDVGKGEVAKESGLVISKTADGQLKYELTGKGAANENLISYNTVETPVGGQYQVVLPDGSRVWLNSASSLRFPSVFNPSDARTVKLTGEAYFEVAPDKKRPFKVISNQQEVEVLGTHFNVNSYDDDGFTKTTLLKGSIKVKMTGKTAGFRILKPGQQSVLGAGIEVLDVDLETIVDWKNGNFYFNNESIQRIMKKLSRWYNVDIEYKGAVPAAVFGGEVSRSKKLAEVLALLEHTGQVHFTIEGRKVIVTR
jgi:transmembrane sensor